MEPNSPLEVPVTVQINELSMRVVRGEQVSDDEIAEVVRKLRAQRANIPKETVAASGTKTVKQAPKFDLSKLISNMNKKPDGE